MQKFFINENAMDAINRLNKIVTITNEQKFKELYEKDRSFVKNIPHCVEYIKRGANPDERILMTANDDFSATFKYIPQAKAKLSIECTMSLLGGISYTGSIVARRLRNVSN